MTPTAPPGTETFTSSELLKSETADTRNEWWVTSSGLNRQLGTHHASPGNGGGERDRTDDLLLAKQALSQLSYTPDKTWWVWLDLNQRPHAYQACALTS